jgi:hypothetical protein
MNTIEKTTEEIKNTLINNRITQFNHHRCNICGEMKKIIITHHYYGLSYQYDSTCNCCCFSKFDISLEELTSFINKSRSEFRNCAIRLNEEIGFGEIYFNDLALKELKTLDYPKISQKELEKTVTEYVKNNKESLDFSKNSIIINDIPFEHTAVKEDFTPCKGTHIGVRLFNKKNNSYFVQYIESFYTTKKEE